jgi:hypothetical protein
MGMNYPTLQSPLAGRSGNPYTGSETVYNNVMSRYALFIPMLFTATEENFLKEAMRHRNLSHRRSMFALVLLIFLYDTIWHDLLSDGISCHAGREKSLFV